VKIYLKMIPRISERIVRKLSGDGDIEVADDKLEEAAMDASSVFRSYVEEEKKINDTVKDQMEKRGLSQKDFMRVKEAVAKDRNFKLGDEGIDFVINQIIELFMMTENVDEVYSEDHVIRKKIFDILKRFLDVDEELDKQARERMKNLEEGTLDWDIAYEKNISQIRQNRGLV